MNKEQLTKNKEQSNGQRGMRKGILISFFFVLFSLLFSMGCSNPFWSLIDEQIIELGELTGTITISPANPEKNDLVNITYTPGPGETVDPSTLTFEWFKENPAGSGKFDPPAVSTANPFAPTDPGTYKIRVKDPATGKVKDKIIIVTDPALGTLTGDIIVTGTGKTGDELTGIYGGAEEPVTYEWFRESPPPATSVSKSNPFRPTDPGTYVVIVTVPGYDPKISDPITVTTTGGLTGDVTIVPIEPVTNEPVTITYDPRPGEPLFPAGYNIEWERQVSPGVFTPIDPQPDPSDTYTPTAPGTYKVTIEDKITGRVTEKIIIVTLGAGLYLGAPSSLLDSAIPIPAVAINNITEAVDYVNANAAAGEYTLLISADINSAPQIFDTADAKLTIIGLGGTPKNITLAGAAGAMFTVGAANETGIRLTLGNNIILTGRNHANTVVRVQNGASLIMEGNSRVTGNINSEFLTSYGGAVVVRDGSSFTMKDTAIITGNRATTNDARYHRAGGVSLFSENTVFRMEGGSVTGNEGTLGATGVIRNIDIIAAGAVKNVYISGNANVGYVSLYYTANSPIDNPDHSFLTIAPDWSGNVTQLNLLMNQSNIDACVGSWYYPSMLRTILKAESGTLSTANVNKFNAALGSFLPFDSNTPTKNITAAHNYAGGVYNSVTYPAVNAPFGFKIADSGPDIGKLVMAEGEANLFLNGSSTPVDSTHRTISDAVTYVNANASAGVYTLRVQGNESINTTQTLNADARLILEGAGGMRTIEHIGAQGQRMFHINGNAATSLIIGNNITLTFSSSNASNYGALVRVENGNFTMKDNSIITGFRSMARNGAVYIEANGSFIMEGGRIHGNQSDVNSNDTGAGVYVEHGTFTMSGGSIDSNISSFGSTSHDANVSVYGTDNVFLSGQALIECLTLNSSNAGVPVINVSGALSGSGGIQMLNLQGSTTLPGVKEIWVGEQIIKGSVTPANIARFTLGEFRWQGIPYREVIGTSHYIDASGVLMVNIITPTAGAGNMYRGAPQTLTAGSTPIAAVTNGSELAAALTTEISTTDEYTILLNNSFDFDGNLTIGADIRVHIIGVGVERTITQNVYTASMFRINGNDASLTLGSNVTLQGHSASSAMLVVITNGNFVMQTGSKITGHSTNDNVGTVGLNGANAIFTMTGGEITGNSMHSNNPSYYSNAGVGVLNGTINMSGGRIYNNSNTAPGAVYSGAADVMINKSLFTTGDGKLNLSGTANIGVLIMAIGNINLPDNFPIINLAGYMSGNGGIGTLHLSSNQTGTPPPYIINDHIAYWTGKQIITGTGIANFVNNRLVLGDFRMARGTPEPADRQPINNTSRITTAGVVAANP